MEIIGNHEPDFNLTETGLGPKPVKEASDRRRCFRKQPRGKSVKVMAFKRSGWPQAALAVISRFLKPAPGSRIELLLKGSIARINGAIFIELGLAPTTDMIFISEFDS